MLLNYNKKFEPIKPVHEAYFGKTKGLQNIEKALNIFREHHMKKFSSFEYINGKMAYINSDSELLAINRMFEKEFGFGCFTLHIVPGQILNAFTAPVDFKIDTRTGKMKENLIADKSGFRFNPKADFACFVCIYSSIMFNPEFTTEEVMALIMHEIGHSFYTALSTGGNGVMVDIFKGLKFITLIYSGMIIPLLRNTNAAESIIQKTAREWRQNNEFIIYITDSFKYIKNLMDHFRTTFYGLLNLLSFNFLRLFTGLLTVFQKIIYNPISFLFLPMTYRNERTADNFATMYGYGPALLSALRKMSDKDGSASDFMAGFNKVPVISTLYNMIGMPSMILLTSVDEHPENMSRMKDQMQLLKRETEKADLDPKMKKVLLSDIKAIEKEMDAAINLDKGFNDPMLAKHAWNKFLVKVTGSNTIKDWLFDQRNKKFDSYDNMYNIAKGGK